MAKIANEMPYEDLKEALLLAQGAVFYFVLSEEGEPRRRVMEPLRRWLDEDGRQAISVPFDPAHPNLVATLMQHRPKLVSDGIPIVFVDVTGIQAATRPLHQAYPENGPMREEIVATQRMLWALNMQRERLASLGMPLVFWVDASTYVQIAEHAADLFATRSGIFDLRRKI